MRYRTIFIAFFIISCTKVYAYTPEIAFGTRQGATLSTVWFSPTVNQTMRLGYTGGITSRFIFEKYFGLQVELNYMQRGWTASAQTTTQEKFKYDISLSSNIALSTKTSIVDWNISYDA